MDLVDKYLTEAVKFDKKSRYEFDHPSDGTTVRINWDEKRKTWYGDTGKFDFDVKTTKELMKKLKKWGYGSKPNDVSKLYTLKDLGR
jgi:hypothetical protein